MTNKRTKLVLEAIKADVQYAFNVELHGDSDATLADRKEALDLGIAALDRVEELEALVASLRKKDEHCDRIADLEYRLRDQEHWSQRELTDSIRASQEATARENAYRDAIRAVVAEAMEQARNDEARLHQD